jgi:very-short-patch-repair endonuclease
LSTSGPSNNWELQTREILRNALPEYDIDPHMRLSNVVKGRIAATQQMAMYEVDFCVREKATGFVVCAIELDGWQHKTENGQRKDGNKNLWLAQAKIQLIRITHPDQAVNIRQLMGQQKQPEEFIRFTPVNNQEFGDAEKTIAAVIVIVVGIWLIIGLINGIGKAPAPKNNNFSISNAAAAAGQKIVEPMAEVIKQRAAENKRVLDAQVQRLAKEATDRQAEAQRIAAIPRPHYEKQLVHGKTFEECHKGNVIDNATMTCMKNHYEMVLVSGNQ